MTALPRPSSARQTLTGLLCAVAASICFSVNDAAIKFLSGGYALHEVVLIRGLVALAFVMAVMVPMAGGWSALRTRRRGALLLRGLLVVFSNLCYFLGLAALPMADTVAIFYVAPLMITALSVPILGERVGPRRWLAVIVGFLGVVVMFRPGGGFHWALALPVISALAYSGMHMMTRLLKGSESAVTMILHVQIVFVAVSAATGLAIGDGRFAGQGDASLAFLFRAWVWPPAGDWPILVATGLLSATGGVLIAQAYRLCEAGLVAPFEYVAVPLAVVWGVALFGEWPVATTWAGMAMICGAGLFVAWREAMLARGAARRERRR